MAITKHFHLGMILSLLSPSGMQVRSIDTFKSIRLKAGPREDKNLWSKWSSNENSKLTPDIMSGLTYVLGFKRNQIQDYVNPRGERNKTKEPRLSGHMAGHPRCYSGHTYSDFSSPSKFWEGGRVGGLLKCHPPYHPPLIFKAKLQIFVTLPS